MAQAEAGQSPALLTMSRCRRDGTLALPPDRRGCRTCGAVGEDIEIFEIAATGIVLDVITVHRPLAGQAAPYLLGEVRLDAGPVVKGICVGEVARGSRVEGRFVSERSQVCFHPVSGGRDA